MLIIINLITLYHQALIFERVLYGVMRSATKLCYNRLYFFMNLAILCLIDKTLLLDSEKYYKGLKIVSGLIDLSRP